jgi:hypothetical protein
MKFWESSRASDGAESSRSVDAPPNRRDELLRRMEAELVILSVLSLTSRSLSEADLNRDDDPLRFMDGALVILSALSLPSPSVECLRLADERQRPDWMDLFNKYLLLLLVIIYYIILFVI